MIIKINKKLSFLLDLDPSESMFCSIEGMSTSVDLTSSYTSSRPDSASTTSKKFMLSF